MSELPLSGFAMFAMSYDDMYGMEMWCKTCQADGKYENLLAWGTYGTEYTLEQIAEVARQHREAAHGE